MSFSTHVFGRVVGENARGALRVEEQRTHLVDVAVADLHRRAGLCARVDSRENRRRREQLYCVPAVEEKRRGEKITVYMSSTV